MNKEEQNAFLSKEYTEANRYIDNAKDALKKAIIQDSGYYKDKKYVETACGVAYVGVLHALDAWLTVKGVQMPSKKKHKTIDFYLFNVAQIDNKLASHINTAYNVLHLSGYYRGETKIKIIEGGFEAAYDIIERIKPEHPVDVTETRAQKVKRTLNNLLVSFAVTFR